MNKVLPIAYVASIYLFAPLSDLFDPSGQEQNVIGEILYTIVFFLPVITGIMNCVYSGKMRKASNTAGLLTAAAIIKYGLIPFFLLGAGLVWGAMIASIVPMMWIFGVPFLIPIFMFIGYVLMVFGSCHTIAYARVKMRTDPSNRLLFVFSMICSFLFVFDVIIVIVLRVMEKRRRTRYYN